jgi:alanyl-tRNA synthetase
VRIGDNKGGRYMSDNFWMMGDTGPCGPCSEIFYDHGPDVAGGPPGSPEQDGDRYIEIWNNVFMQFNRTDDGVMHKLPKPSVDTGMGLERLAAVLQHVHSNYQIDMFVRLLAAAKNAVEFAAGGTAVDADSPSLKVIADHIRACTFTVVDGVIPGNEGRGYVLRRIARRGIRHGYKLGARKPFFYTLVAPLAVEMGEAYPELRREMARVTEVLKQEEERFFQTIANGMEILEGALAGGAKVVDGDVAFKLHDTYGFPLDLTADVCRERGVTVDEAGFNIAMNRQREQARAAGKFKMAAGLDYKRRGHHLPRLRAPGVRNQPGDGDLRRRHLGAQRQGRRRRGRRAGPHALLCRERRPGRRHRRAAQRHGARGGGRHDQDPGRGAWPPGPHRRRHASAWGDTLVARVDGERRARTVRNHSATHLMHKALREVLGAHVQQKGSLVNAERTRFDFAHNAPVSDAQIAQVEALVNAEILANAATQARVLPIEEAQKLGAMMLFGEKYGDEVRVLDIGTSRELCGGTHVQRTGDIGLFKIVAEGGVAAGIRRVEAVTGGNALAYLQQLEGSVNGLASTLKATPAEVPGRVAAVLDQVRALEKEVESLKGKLASAQGDELLAQAVDVKGLKVLAAVLQGADAKALRETMDKLKDKLKSAAIVLAAVEGGKVQLAAGVTADSIGKVKAGELVNFVAQQVGGKGGGKPDLAMAGGTDAAALPAALASVAGWVAQRT